MLLPACATRATLPVKLIPPTSLMQDCPETEVPLVINGDLVRKVRALRVDLKNCNADKASLRAWAKDNQ